MTEGKVILKCIIERNANWLGRILKDRSVQKIERKINERKNSGRKEFGMITAIKGGKAYRDTKRETQDTKKWRKRFSSTCPRKDYTTEQFLLNPFKSFSVCPYSPMQHQTC